MLGHLSLSIGGMEPTGSQPTCCMVDHWLCPMLRSFQILLFESSVIAGPVIQIVNSQEKYQPILTYPSTDGLSERASQARFPPAAGVAGQLMSWHAWVIASHVAFGNPFVLLLELIFSASTMSGCLSLLSPPSSSWSLNFDPLGVETPSGTQRTNACKSTIYFSLANNRTHH